MFALTQTTINNGTETIQTVDARQLHAALENGSHFRDWINRRIEEYGFEAGVDYVLVSLKFERNSEKGRPSKEYAIKIDMAKELCMLETAHTVSMTSLEIAQLTGKMHRNVVRDIVNMFAALREGTTAEIDVLKFEHITFTYEDSSKRTQIAYRLNPEAVMLLVTGYSVRLRAAVILRLKELEETVSSTHLSIHKQILALEAQDKTTFQFASWGSKKMNERKKSIKTIRSERERLFKEAQVQLFAE